MSKAELTGYQPGYVLLRLQKPGKDLAEQQRLLVNYLGIAAHYVAGQPASEGTSALQKAMSNLPGLTAANISSNSASEIVADEDSASVDLVDLAAAQVLETLGLDEAFKAAFRAFFEPPLDKIFDAIVAQPGEGPSVRPTISFGLVNAAVSDAPSLNFVKTGFVLRKEKKSGVFGSTFNISLTVDVAWNGYQLGSPDTARKFVDEETQAGLITDLSQAGLLKTFTIDT
ncbi:hypothetical protein [Roseibium aggregatum]|uniref:Uncharacterized protein n=1 Tax=Roseibium aggregatum TaxID=187304 RepID=A0A939EFP6_9HYPH|nr:hypothetical protein [Roseibium aggregatum]MBN9671318.1 hypothetical protein [Roseibium aggregatum]